MIEEDFEISLKVIVVGDGGVGKTSMIKRYCTGTFTETYKKTLGVDFLEKEMYLDNVDESVTLMLWDTAGQEEFDAITQTYYRGAQACVIMFSTINRQSFDHVRTWNEKVRNVCGKIPTVLVQNKVDLIDDAVVSSDEAEALASELSFVFYRTCVKENLNVEEVFGYLGAESVAALRDPSYNVVEETDQIGNPEPETAQESEPEEKPKDKVINLDKKDTKESEKRKKGFLSFCAIL